MAYSAKDRFPVSSDMLACLASRAASAGTPGIGEIMVRWGHGVTVAFASGSSSPLALGARICALAAVLFPVLSATAAPCQDRETARAAFADAVAAEFGVDVGNVTVQPRHPGLPDNPYDALAAGPYLAFEASHPARDARLRGFATPDGRVVLGRAAGDMPDFLAFAGLADRPPQADALARRLMWIFETGVGTRLIAGHPEKPEVVPPAVIHLPDGGIQVVWFVTIPGNTGYIGTYRCLFQMNADGTGGTYSRAPA
ncbi:MAG: hypothetical protein Kow0013_29670 [Pararhodobacter sp.]